MEIKYLGTAAAEGIPAMFCGCETCKRALMKGKKNIMTRSQALINDDLLIDFNPDTHIHFVSNKMTLANIDYMLITHSHGDHLSGEDFYNRFPGFCHDLKTEKLKVFLTQGALDVVNTCKKERYFNNPGFEQAYEFIVIEPYVPFNIGTYTITPLPAIHMTTEQAVIFLIEQDGKTIFYGNDTGIFPEEIDDYLAKNGKKIDLLSLDCTKCDNNYDYYTHMSMEEGKAIYDRFKAKGLLSDNVQCYYNHFSHNGHQIYDDLVKSAKKYGFKVCYDGLEIKL